MYQDQPWIKYADDLIIDWQHAFEEGKLVAEFKEKCNEISNMSASDPNRKVLADEMYEVLKNAQVKDDFPYDEPSDLELIKASRTKNRPLLNPCRDKVSLYNKVYGAWLGRVSGCLLGKPIEGWKTPRINKLLKATGNYPLNNYISSYIPKELQEEVEMSLTRAWINNINGKAPVDDDTNYTVIGLKIIERYGRNFCSQDVAEAWLSYLPYLSTCTAERVAYRNLAAGILPPESAVYKNPFREWIGAQIRADIFGYINPGNTEIAAEMAWRDAAISHVKNGIYGEMFIAAMLAAAAVTDDLTIIIEAGLGEIPESSRLAEKIRLVQSWYKGGVSAERALSKVHSMYDENDSHDWCHTISNAMIVVTGLLYGNKDFEKSICIAVQAGFDTDCNGATVGSIVGMIIGAEAIPQKWAMPFNNTLSTTISGYETVNLSDIANKTIDCME